MEYEVKGEGISPERAAFLAATQAPLDEVFAVDVEGLMREYDDAMEFLAGTVVFGETDGYILDNWNFHIVGFEEDNILHIRITGDVVEGY